MWNILLWILSIVSSGFFLFSAVFGLVMYSDLMENHVSPLQMASKVNTFWKIDFFYFSFLCTTFLLCGYWVVFLFHSPMILMNFYYMFRKTHLVDPTTILQRNEAQKFRNRSIVKLVFSLLSFFVYLYMLITEAIASSPKVTPSSP
eukprot:TRINITY_DN7529_c0_g1_i2.p1 TRINITY_DN7529_c0_g1~~TRINITY_DN7529_c0_g1_i2.p1  ORF type:complete len:146 (-),score=13.84 TRINITY_DN7529_c0_g1_i2:225-662(-)